VEAFEGGERILILKDLANDRELKSTFPFAIHTSPRFTTDGKCIVYRTLRSEKGAEPKAVILHSSDLTVFEEIPLAGH
jgi:hypothetical protein